MIAPESVLPQFDAPLELSLHVAGIPLRVWTNDAVIRDRLVAYFAPYVVSAVGVPVAEVQIIQGTSPMNGTFEDVVRGRAGRSRRPSVRCRVAGSS